MYYHGCVVCCICMTCLSAKVEMRKVLLSTCEVEFATYLCLEHIHSFCVSDKVLSKFV